MTSVFIFGLECVLLLAFTQYLVTVDRSFSKRVRREFQLALLSCFLLLSIEVLMANNNIFLMALYSGLRLLVLCFLIAATVSVWNGKKYLIYILAVLGFALGFLPGQLFSHILFCIAAVILGFFVVFEHNKKDKTDIVFSVVTVTLLILASFAEYFYDVRACVNDILSIIACSVYFYFFMSTYKKDRLTGLLMRHNLSFEMEDLGDRYYDLVLIDVDNFKLINDKYGHDKGDEALVSIVTETLKFLPKGCRMYRFGGDEFVIVSRKVETEVLRNSLEKVNDNLAELDLRMSYGIVNHKPNDDSSVSLAEADKAMYENKRFIKSEDIWDDMTGLYNLRGFMDELDLFRKNVIRDGKIVCLVAVDVERLSNINKAYGYTEGNLIITVLSKSLKNCLRGRDFIGHLGSDEFIVAIECSDTEDSYISFFINQLIEHVDTAYELSDRDYTVKLNIDRLFITSEEKAPSNDLVNNLLYVKQEEKDNRRKNDNSEVDNDYDEVEDAYVTDILDNNRLKYAFQPIVSAKNGDIVAYESLMRSDTDVKISPLKILKYADRNKRTYDIEKLTLFNTLERVHKELELFGDAQIFINSLPGYLLSEVDFELLKSKYGHLFPRTVLEITERREIDDDSLAILNMRREKGGFDLAIDDYGSGWSNTNNLLRYMPQIVKLDRLLITGIDRNNKKQFFVNSIIQFAKDNDMLTLAEGVETENELRTVIKLGVDLVQGYIVSKPSVDIITAIPDSIKGLIVNENLRVVNNQRAVYTAGESCELSVVQLAMEDYTKINVSAEYVTITGSSEYSADMTIKLKDNLDCQLTLSDVRLNSVDDRPCIELGENTNLVLDIEGNCYLNSKGILVPESSSLTVIGTGSLTVNVKGHECYAIGNDTLSAFGNISINSSLLINILLDGERCVGIGGGLEGTNSQINLLSGTINLNVAGVQAVGVGAYTGNVPIRCKDIEMRIMFRVNNGSVIGTLDGVQDIDIRNFNMDINGSGTEISVFGSPDKVYGNIILNAGSVNSKFSGHNISFIGGEKGDFKMDITHSSVVFKGEGDNVTAFGTRDLKADVVVKESSVEVIINSSAPLAIGAVNKDILYVGPSKTFILNGIATDIYDL